MSIASFLFEHSPFNEFWAAWTVGFCVVGLDGKVYLTTLGQEYLSEIGR